MITLPINANTFKKSFLDGNGSLEISTDQDIWKTLYDSNQPFTRDKPSLVQIKFGAGTTKAFQFGESGPGALQVSTAVSAEAIGAVKLIWPGSNDPLIAAYDLKNELVEGRLYGAVVFSGKADASVKGSADLFGGPLKATFGVAAGASAGYDRLVLFNATQSARAIVDELFGGTRLPQSIRTVADIPEPGEILAFRYGGYLNLSASLAWGYSFTGTKAIKAQGLELALKYAVRLAASASFQYRLAGEFGMECRRGHDTNWVRYVVRKSRESSMQFAADFGFFGEASLSGLPDTPDKLLAALLGTDAQSILGVLATVEENSTIEGLEKSVGKLAKKFIFDRADEWIGKALNADTVKEFLGRAHQIIEQYQGLDEKIVHLYEDFLDNQIPGLEASLKLLLGAGSREDLQKITDSNTWDLVRRLWNEKFHDLLADDGEFAEFSALLKKVDDFLKGGAAANVRNLIKHFKEAFPLNGLLNQLAKYDTPEELKAEADEKLQALIGRIIGRTFSELSNSDFKLALKQLQAVLGKIGDFRKAYSKAIGQAAHQSVAFQLSYLYKSASKGEALLDLEIDLSQPEGAQLAALARNGNFVDILRQANPQLVRINKGKFTHELTRSAEVSVSIFNWNRRGIVELVQNSEHSVESVAGGLLHVYSIDTSTTQTTQKTDWHKFKEQVRSNFALSIVGQAPQPAGAPESAIDDRNRFLIETLRTVTVKYDLEFQDDRTRADEMTQYLRLAEYLKLIPSAAALVKELQQQFPGGLGKTSVTYVVRYDDAAVRNGLTRGNLGDLQLFGRKVARELIAAKFTALPEGNWQGPMGFAYLDPTLYETYRAHLSDFERLTVEVPLPDWYAKSGTHKSTLRKVDLTTLSWFYSIEDEFVERLGQLSTLVRSAPGEKIPENNLRDATRHFIEMADDLESAGGVNTFFGVFDRISQEGLVAGGVRKSALVIEITGKGQTEKVTKYLIA